MITSPVSPVHPYAWILASLFLLLSGPASATDIDLSGSCSWNISGSTINIVAGKVQNQTSGGSSGTLRLQIWATDFPYSGGGISGYVLGTRTLGTLQGGYSYNSISGSVAYTTPPHGLYYTTMTVEEYSGGGYVIRDYLTFSGTSELGTGGGGGGGSLEIEGNGSWRISGTSIDISADKISNNRTGGTSGSLRLQIWATLSPYSGGLLTGYSIGTRTLTTLQGGSYYSNVSGYVSYQAPPVGTYYTVMTLEEYGSGGYNIVDYLTFSGTSNLGTGGGGENTGTIDMVGSTRYRISGKRVNLMVSKISNTRSVGTSGTLRLRLFATKTRYNGKSLTGRVVATRSLGQLGAKRYFSKINGKVTFIKPPRGNYHMTLVVEEYVNGRYVIRDYARFSSKYRSR